MLLGYYETENMFRLFDIEGNAMIKCKDALFFEEILGYGKFSKEGLPVGRDILGEPLASISDDWGGIIELVGSTTTQWSLSFMCWLHTTKMMKNSYL